MSYGGQQGQDLIHSTPKEEEEREGANALYTVHNLVVHFRSCTHTHSVCTKSKVKCVYLYIVLWVLLSEIATTLMFKSLPKAC